MIITTAPCTHPTAEVAKSLDQHSLDRGVNVFIVGVGEHSTGADFFGKCRKCVIKTRCVFGTEDVRARQLPHMGSGLGDVVGREPPVEMH